LRHPPEHRVDVFVAGHLHIKKVRAGFVDGFFESLSQLPRLIDGAAFESISTGELFGIREAIELNRTETVVIEQRLPLADHAKIAVVHHDDLDGQSVRSDGGEFGDGHLKAAITADREDEFIGTGHLRAQCGGESKAHRAEAAGINPEARFVEADQLGRPHLVLPDVRSDDGLAAGETIDLIHKVLRFDFVFGAGAIVRMLILPPANPGPPTGPGGCLLRFPFGREFLEDDVELLQNAPHVTHDRDIGNAILAHFGGIDIHMYDAGVTGERLQLAGDAVIETSAEGDEQIAFSHAHVGGVTAVHTGHADEIRMAGRQAAESHQSADRGKVNLLHERGQFGGSVAENGTTAGIDKRALGFPDQLRGTANLASMAFGEYLITGQVDGIDRSVVATGLENVLRDVDEHGTGTTAGGDVKSLVKNPRQLLDIFHHEVVFGGGARDAEGVGFLESIAADELGGDLAGDGDDGDGIHHGVDEPGDEVGGAGSGGGATDADLPGGAGIAFGGEAGILFVAHKDVLDVAVIEGIVKRQGDAARIAEEAIDAFAREAFEEDFSAIHQFSGFGLHTKTPVHFPQKKRPSGGLFTPLMASDLSYSRSLRRGRLRRGL